MHFLRHLSGLLACCSSVIIILVGCSAAVAIAATRLPLSTNDSTSSSENINLTSFSSQLLNTTALDSYHQPNLTHPLSAILPYGFAVPSTRTYLRLGFGLLRRRLDPLSMGGLIAVAQYEVERGIERDGADFFPGIDGLEQKIGWSLGDGFTFVLHNNYEVVDQFFSWQQARNVVEGLRLYLIVGERFYATEFAFWDGPRLFRFALGGGGIVVNRVEGEGGE